MTEISSCPVCKLDSPDFQIVDDTGDYGEQIICDCARCGKFLITRTASAYINREDFSIRAKVSSWLRMQNEFQKPMPKIRVNDGTLDKILKTLPEYTPNQKQSILLNVLSKKSEHPGKKILFIPKFDYPLAWASNEDEFVFHTKSLIRANLIECSEEKELDKDMLTTELVVTSKGWDNLQNSFLGQVDSETAPSEHFDEHGFSDRRQTESHWDGFISHASEDKDNFVRPLAEALVKKGLKVWYDEFTLKLGDSLRRSIDRGLSQSKWGIVIISPYFLKKEWPQKELDGLVAREINGRKVILPIWHDITYEDLVKYSPTLADRLATKSSFGLKQVVSDLLDAMEIKA